MKEFLLKSLNTQLSAATTNNGSIFLTKLGEEISLIIECDRIICAIVTVFKNLVSNYHNHRDHIHFECKYESHDAINDFLYQNIYLYFDEINFKKHDQYDHDISLVVDVLQETLDEAYSIIDRANHIANKHADHIKYEYDKSGLMSDDDNTIYSTNEHAVRLANSIRSLYPSAMTSVNISSKKDFDGKPVRLPTKRSDIIDDNSIRKVIFYVTGPNKHKRTASIDLIDNNKTARNRHFTMTFNPEMHSNLSFCDATNSMVTAKVKRKIKYNSGNLHTDSFHLEEILSIDNSVIPKGQLNLFIDELQTMLGYN